MVSRGRPYHFKFFKDCPRQILFSLFLDKLTQMILQFFKTQHIFSVAIMSHATKNLDNFGTSVFMGIQSS